MLECTQKENYSKAKSVRDGDRRDCKSKKAR
jgi:hypothetical protein